jgi:hypothetical protein
MIESMINENASVIFTHNYAPMLLALSNTVNEKKMAAHNASGAFLLDIDNDYFQHEIYYEVRRNNSKTETWHHFFGVFGTLISLFGMLGK